MSAGYSPRPLSARAVRFGKEGERAFIASRREAEKLTEKLLAEILRWQRGASVPQSELTQALLFGTPEEVAAAIMPPAADEALRAEYERIAGQVIEIAGDAQWKELDFEGSFNLANPYSPQWMRSHGAELVQEIGDLSRYAIREEVARAFEQGLAPRDIARTLGDWAGLRRDQARTLDAFAASLRAAGISGDPYDAKVARYAARLRKERGMLIARTEVINAHGHGTEQSWETARASGLLGAELRKVWIAAMGSERTCKICRDLDGRTAAIGEPFVGAYTSTEAPTAHPQCRCAIGLEIQK